MARSKAIDPRAAQRGSRVLKSVYRSLKEIWRRRTRMIPTVMRMDRISRFDKATPEILKNPFSNASKLLF